MRVRLYAEDGNYSAALPDYNTLILIDNQMSDWYRLRAEVLKKLGRSAAAVTDIERAKVLENHL
jgi:tetratricopeptide (TPR) repeat protein